MSDQTKPSPREKAIADICARTGKTREQAVAFLDLARSAFARRGWAEGESLNQDQIGERLATFMGAKPDEENRDV
ncbi:hypothetical protein ACWEOE_31785 [Amycolatopsis sp. NPDC004368]